jgi:hypothetical protein
MGRLLRIGTHVCTPHMQGNKSGSMDFWGCRPRNLQVPDSEICSSSDEPVLFFLNPAAVWWPQPVSVLQDWDPVLIDLPIF